MLKNPCCTAVVSRWGSHQCQVDTIPQTNQIIITTTTFGTLTTKPNSKTVQSDFDSIIGVLAVASSVDLLEGYSGKENNKSHNNNKKDAEK